MEEEKVSQTFVAPNLYRLKAMIIEAAMDYGYEDHNRPVVPQLNDAPPTEPKKRTRLTRKTMSV